MLTVLGSPKRCCDGFTRREALQVGALGLFGGLNLASAAVGEGSNGRRAGRARSVIHVFLLGGAATQDMYDLKPNAPAEIRGEFQPIATNVPGIQVCEHLPRLARWMHRIALVRSVNHKAGCHNCLPCYTGFDLPMPDQHPRDSDHPSMGSICEYLKTRSDELPDYIYMPCWLGWGQAFRRAGPYAGFLGRRFDPLTTECQPYYDKALPAPTPGSPRVVLGQPYLSDSSLASGITIDRLNERRSLLEQLDDKERLAARAEALGSFSRTQERAFDLLASPRVKQAFDLGCEDPRTLDRYGRTLFGHSTLIARRLVEQGVRFVNVTWDLFWDRVQVDYDAWDTHTKNFSILKENKLPHFDQTFTALLEDLEGRGLLDETLVVVTSEMGRTPKINGNAGRDHWTFCYGTLLAGAGIRGGTVYGASDAHAAYVKDLPVAPGDICATIYECLGIDPELPITDRSGRPVPVALGRSPIREIMA
jgi:hypothetical protein